jgi:hypothetical protein
MEGGDIAAFDRPSRACIFEGLLAEPPTRKKALAARFSKDKDVEVTSLRAWVANERPLKSLIDTTNRVGIHTMVFTLMGPAMEEPIYQWLLQKGVTTTVRGYNAIEEFSEDLKYDRGIHTVYVTKQEHWSVLGLRATVVSPTTPWSV